MSYIELLILSFFDRFMLIYRVFWLQWPANKTIVLIGGASLLLGFILIGSTGIIVLVVSILIVNVLMLNNGLKNKAIREKMQMYDTYVPVLENVIEELRAKQHDYHNHIQALESIYMDCSNNSQFNDYKKLLMEEDIWSKLIKMDNKILMAFLFNRYINALDMGIHINYTIRNYLVTTKHTDYELIELFGVLIDNAIEETRRLDEINVEILISYEDGMNVVQTKNKSREISSFKIKRMFRNGYTTKNEGGCGIGLYKLQKLLKKRDGNITVYYDNDENEVVFTVRHN